MSIGGYLNRWLFVNLTDGSISEEEFDEKTLRDFVGGYGLGAKILYDRMEANVDPLGPKNILGFLGGPLTGTPAVIGSRFVVVGKSPLTGGWGDANCGGNFGPHMKFAGVDGVFFEGIADKPVYLHIREGKAEIRSAEHLWGKNGQDTEDAIKEEVGKDAEVAYIGISGEKQALISCILTDYGRAAGRSGLGAVMGSKNLKAVVVQGKGEVPLHDAERTAEVRKECLKNPNEGMFGFFHGTGTCGTTEPNLDCGDHPVKNWGGSVPADFDKAAVGGSPIIERQARRYGCWRCPQSCGGHMKLSPEQTVRISHKPEYETVATFGGMCLNDDLDSIILANDICNDYGLDTISGGSTVAFAIECYENGLLSKEDTGGLELTWGNNQAIVAFTELMAKREGIGDLFADGVRVAARKLGKGAEEFAVEVGGQEPGMHNPLFYPGLSFSFQMDATPGRHTQGAESWGSNGLQLEEADKYDYASPAMARNRKRLLTLLHTTSALGLCHFGVVTYPLQSTVDFIKSITGWDADIDEILLTGERIANIRLLFNLREGLNPINIPLHGRLVGIPQFTDERPIAGITVDADTVRNALLDVMDWDKVTCEPSAMKLEELGLSDAVRSAA